MKQAIHLFAIGLIVLFACNTKKKSDPFDSKFFEGNWTYRSLRNVQNENIPFCVVDSSIQKKDSCGCKSPLEFATAVMRIQSSKGDSIFGLLDMGEGYALNLKGKLTTTDGATTFYIQGDGVANSNTNNWEYDYQGYTVPKWVNGIKQLDACVGGVIRSKPHDTSPAGYTASFYMVRQ